jgi:hypothetical protein
VNNELERQFWGGYALKLKMTVDAEGRNRVRSPTTRRESGRSQAGENADCRNPVVDPDLVHALEPKEIKAMADSDDTMYVLDHNLRVRAYNRAYREFALANGASDLTTRYGIGSHILDAFGGFFREHYEKICRKVLETGQRFSCEYECSSKELFRIYREVIRPLFSRKGLLVCHTNLESRPHRSASRLCHQSHRSEDGLIIRCCHCHRIRNHAESERWDWVPEVFDQSDDDTSHAICPRCRSVYYADLFSEAESA